MPTVPQDRFYLRVSPEQIKQFDLIDPGVREITISPDGEFIHGVDFLLRKTPARPMPDLPREEPHEQK